MVPEGGVMQLSTLSEREKPVAFDPINALSALPFAVLVIDQDSRIAFMNGAAEQFFEQGAKGLTGRRLNELLPPDSPLFSLIAQASSGQTSV
ncbi:MAG: two-component system nitrogen regulation sensor histidine kinase GlnL, partial [Paracoccaceae bacterium]